MDASAKGLSEDWLAVILGLGIFLLSLGSLAGTDLLGWAAAPKTWVDPASAVLPVAAAYHPMGAPLALLSTYLFTLALMAVSAWLLGANVARFVFAFTIIFVLSYICWVIGNYAVIAVTTPADLKKFGLSWSMKLTGESGYLIALLVGVAIANFIPAFARMLNEATRPELFIKTAIVVLGATLGVKAAQQLGLASTVMFRGMAAIVEAYLIYWAVVYFVARKYFGFSREWAAPLASGISICGVSAAIATGGAIRARPMVPVMVSSLVVVFAMVELLILPFLASTWLAHEPMVAAAWMGLAVKTDGAAVASGAVTEALVYADAASKGVIYDKGWMVGATTTVKVFIDIFIGVWAFILAYIWTRHIEPSKGDKAQLVEIWERFPKFVLGFMATFFIVLFVGLYASAPIVKTLTGATEEANVFRQLFFLLTFFTIGLMADMRRLWDEGIGRLAAVYVVCLFGFVIWVGLAISWIFFHGVKPPVIAG